MPDNQQRISLGSAKFRFVRSDTSGNGGKPFIEDTSGGLVALPSTSGVTTANELSGPPLTGNIVTYDMNGVTFMWVFNKSVIQGRYIDGTPWVKGISGLELVSCYPRPEYHPGLTCIPGSTSVGIPVSQYRKLDVYVNGIIKNPTPTTMFGPTGGPGNYTVRGMDPLDNAFDAAARGTSFYDGKSAFDSRMFGIINPGGQPMSSPNIGPGFTGNSYLRQYFDPVLWEKNSGKVNNNYNTSRPVRLTCEPGDVFVHASSYFSGPTSDIRCYPADTNNTPYAHFGVPDSPRKRSCIRGYGVFTVVGDIPGPGSFRPPMVWPEEIKHKRPQFNISDITVPDPTGPAVIPNNDASYSTSNFFGITASMRNTLTGEIGGATTGFFAGPVGAFGNGNGYANLMPHRAVYGVYWNPDTSVGSGLPWTWDVSTYGTGYVVTHIAKILATVHSDGGNPAPVGSTAYNWVLERRKTLLNRVIQYGIDMWGFYMHNAVLTTSAGQKTYLCRPACIAAGYWLGNTSMMNPEQALIEARFNPSHPYWVNSLSLTGSNGFTGWNNRLSVVAGVTYPLYPVGLTKAIATCMSAEAVLWNPKIAGGTWYNSVGYPSPYGRTFGCTMTGFTAGYVNSITSKEPIIMYDNGDIGIEKVGLTFAKVNFGLLYFGPLGADHTGGSNSPLPGFDAIYAPSGITHLPSHGGKATHIPLLNLKIVDGAGSGPTDYKIIASTPVRYNTAQLNLNSGSQVVLPKDNTIGATSTADAGAAAKRFWMMVDRPWQNGLPDSTSVLRIQPWLNSDVGKIHFNISLGNRDNDANPSPVSSYKAQAMQENMLYYLQYLKTLDARVDSVLDEDGYPLAKFIAGHETYTSGPAALSWKRNAISTSPRENPSGIFSNYYYHWMGSTLQNNFNRGSIFDGFTGMRDTLSYFPGISYAIDKATGLTIYPTQPVEQYTNQYFFVGSGAEGSTIPEITGPTAATFGYDAKAFARWTTVPFSEYGGSTFTVGVVAYHVNDINRVEFSVGGGPWKKVTSKQYNPATKFNEYFITIDPQNPFTQIAGSRFIDVKAIAYPNSGIPRILQGTIDRANPPTTAANQAGSVNHQRVRYEGNHELVLYVNKNNVPVRTAWVSPGPTGNDTTGEGTSGAPFRTVGRAMHFIKNGLTANLSYNSGTGEVAGSVVYLMEGYHGITGQAGGVGTSILNSMTTAIKRWVTLKAAPGLTAGQVKLFSGVTGVTLPFQNGSSQTAVQSIASIQRLKIQDVTFYNDSNFRQAFPNMIRSPLGPTVVTSGLFWADRCESRNENRDGSGNLLGPTFGGGWANGTPMASGAFASTYITNSHMFNCFNGYRTHAVSLNNTTERFGDTPWLDWGLCLNGTASNFIQGGGVDAHDDIIHYFTSGTTTGVTYPRSLSNGIWSNIVMTGTFDNQGIFYEYLSLPRSGTASHGVIKQDLVLDGFTATKFDPASWGVGGASSSNASWWEMDTDHLIMQNIYFPDQAMRFKAVDRDKDSNYGATPLQLKNVLIKNYTGYLLDWGGTTVALDNPQGSTYYLTGSNIRIQNYNNTCTASYCPGMSVLTSTYAPGNVRVVAGVS